MPTQIPKKLRVWRLLEGKTLREVATQLRLPAYVVSAVERGEVEPSPRWVSRFEEIFGPKLAAELLAPAEVIAAARSLPEEPSL